MVRLPIKKWISNLLTFYSESPKNTSLNEKKIKKESHQEKIIMTEQGILKIKSSNEDSVTLDLCDLHISLSRFITYDIPHEVSVYVPRAEIRKTLKMNSNNNNEYISEVILNSITIVHSPNLEAQKPKEITSTGTSMDKVEDKKEDNKKEEEIEEIDNPTTPDEKPKTQIGFKYSLNK